MAVPPCYSKAMGGTPTTRREDSLLLRRKRQHVHRRRPPTLPVAVLNRHVHQLLGLIDRFDQREPIGQPRRNRGAERIAAAVGFFLRLSLGGEFCELATIEEQI